MKTSFKIKLARIISQLIIFFFKKKNINVKRNNINWNLDLNEAIDLSIFLTGRFEPSILRTIKRLTLKNDYDYLDIGANCGAHTLYLAKEFSHSKIFAIEPTNYTFNKLLKNIDLNPNLKKQIIPIQAFISSKKTKPENVYTSWQLSSKDNKHSQHLGIKKPLNGCDLITLDKLVEENKIKKSIIKCDVDGNELFVFNSGFNYLKEFKPIIIMELAPYLYPENGYNSSELFNFFSKINYKFYDVSNQKQIINIQDFSDSITIGSSKNIFLI